MKLIQEGPRDAKIMLVGAAPTKADFDAGRPFTQGTGKILDMMLNRAGISRSQCFITNVVHQPVFGGFDDEIFKPANQAALVMGLLRLKADMDAIKPNVVVGLGAAPLRVLTGKQGIDKWRGSILESVLRKGQKVISTYSPGYVIKIWDYKAVAEMDFQRIRGDSKFPELRLPERQYYLDPDSLTRLDLVNQMERAEWLSIDIECVYSELSGEWKLKCVGFSDRADRALVIAADTAGKMADIRRLCACPAKKVFQNGMFDVTVLEQDEHIPVTNFAWDTMLAHHSLYTECASGSNEMDSFGNKKPRQAAIAKGLAFINSICTREPYYKDDGKLWKQDGDINQFYLYNGKDAAVTREIRDVQEIDLNALGLMPVLDHAMSLVRPLLAAMWRGIRIDTAKRSEVQRTYEEEINRLQEFLNMQAGGFLNVKSSPAIQKYLYETLKLPAQRKRNKTSGEMRDTADKDAIVALAKKYNNPGLMTILEIRERRDYQERYVNVDIDPDDRLRCSIDVTGTNSGRLASRKSIKGTGTNLQNIPTRKAIGQRIKQYMIADPGKVLVQRDYKQAEAWIVAHEALCEPLIELFMDPTRDIHKENAARIFNKRVDEITSTERYLAKKVVHASNYGMGAFRLMQLVNQETQITGISIDIHEAQRLIDLYFMIYPEIKENFWYDVEQELRHKRSLTNCFGRRRFFFGRWDDELLRQAYSFRPQSGVGDLCSKAVVRCYQEIELGRPDLGAEFLMPVHDSILYQCNRNAVEEVAYLMEECMKIPIEVRGYKFTIPSDCEVGLNWAKADKKKVENPNGLVPLEEYVA